MSKVESSEPQDFGQRSPGGALAESIYGFQTRPKPEEVKQRGPKPEDAKEKNAKPEGVKQENPAKPPARDNFFAGKPDSDELKKLRPEVDTVGRATIDIHLGLKFDKTSDGQKLLKSLNAEVTEKATQIKRHINTTGRNPADVLGEAIRDPGKVTFYGEEHTANSPSRELLRTVIEKAPSTAILTPEFPSALRPLFDRYNASPKDSKFTLPADLDQLVGAKAAAYCRFNDEIIESASLFETAHRRGIKIIPVDDPATMDVIDVIPADMLKDLANKDKADEIDPRQDEVARNLNRAISEFTRGGLKNPARERTIADNILAVTNEFPDSPIVAHTGRTHASEHTPEETPAAKLLASDPELLKKGKQVVSFGVYDYDGQLFNSSLSSFARELDRPVCFPSALDNDRKNPIARLPEITEAASDNFGAYDQVILMCPKANELKSTASKDLPKLELTESYLKEKITPGQRTAIEDFLTLGNQRWKEMRELYERNGITGDEINTLQTTANSEGKDPVKMIREAASPRSLVLIDDRSSRFLDLDENQGRSPSQLVSEAIAGLPAGSKLAVDIPVIFAPYIDRYNKSPQDTAFETVYANPDYKKLLKDENTAEMMLSSTVFRSDRLQMYEAAHRRGIEIVPIGTNVDIGRTRDVSSAVATANSVHAEAIAGIAGRNPTTPIVVWSNRLSQAHEIEQLLNSNDQFRSSNREIKTIGFAGSYSNDTLGPLARHLEKPIGLDLSTPALTNLASRSLASGPLSPDSSYRDCIQVLGETLGRQYDQLIMIPKKNNH